MLNQRDERTHAKETDMLENYDQKIFGVFTS